MRVEERSRKIWRKKEGRQEGRTQRGTKWREQRKEEGGLSEMSWWGQCEKHTEAWGRNRLIRGHQQRGDHLGSHFCGVKNASQCLVPRTSREQILDQIVALNVCTWSQKMRSSPVAEGEAALKWRSCLEWAWEGALQSEPEITFLLAKWINVFESKTVEFHCYLLAWKIKD